ncbi:MAG TPA: hypothetical protein VFR37_21570 [Longimicrobium sp.]|nr:hypothetical protein [Longimicrobium sp.]
MRTASRGSSKSTIPRMLAPTTPIPVHTAYPVPTGSVRSAVASSQKLAPMAESVPTLGHSRVNPSVYLSPIAQITSSNPAITRNTHAIAPSTAVVTPLPDGYTAKGRGSTRDDCGCGVRPPC